MKFLIVKTSSLGDIIQAFPTLFFLRERFPSAQIDWVVEERFADIVKSVPMISRVICMNSHRWRKSLANRKTWREISSFTRQLREADYDVAFDLQSNCKSSLVLWRVRAKTKVGFGLKTAHEFPNVLFTDKRFDPPPGLNIRDDYLFLARRYFNDEQPLKNVDLEMTVDEDSLAKNEALLSSLPTKPRIMICAGSAWANKQLTPETLQLFMKHIQNELNASFLFIWGSQAEKEAALRLQSSFPDHAWIVDRLSLPALQSLMRQVDLIISMDSLPLHLAGLTRTPTFSLFGASLSSKYKPTGAQHFSFQGSCPFGRTFVKRCPILRTCSTGACIRGLNADDLFREFIQWWRHWSISQ